MPDIGNQTIPHRSDLYKLLNDESIQPSKEFVFFAPPFQPAIQKVTSKLYYASFARKSSMLDDVLYGFFPKLNEQQIIHAIDLIVGNVQLDLAGVADRLTLDLLSSFANCCYKFNENLPILTFRNSYKWTEEMLDVFLLKKPGYSHIVKIYQLIKMAVRKMDMVILRYLYKRRMLSLTLEMAIRIFDKFDQSSADVDLFVYILNTFSEINPSPRTIIAIAGEIYSLPTLKRVLKALPNLNFASMFPSIFKKCSTEVYNKAFQEGFIIHNSESITALLANPNIQIDVIIHYCNHFHVDLQNVLREVDWLQVLPTIPVLRLDYLFESYIRQNHELLATLKSLAEQSISHLKDSRMGRYFLELLEFSVHSIRQYLLPVGYENLSRAELKKRLDSLTDCVKLDSFLEIFDASLDDPIIQAIESGRIDLAAEFLYFLEHLRNSGISNPAPIQAEVFVGIERLPEPLFDLSRPFI